MRIDSMTYFNSGLVGMQDNQAAIARLNQQIATGQKLLAPKDDPLATEKVLGLSNRVAVRTQFSANQDRASLALKYENTVLTEMDKTLTSARSLVSALSPSHDPSLLDVNAQQLEGYARHLLSLANTRDPSGSYIFGGFDTVNVPYSNPLDGSATATTYGGTPLLPTVAAPDGQTAPGGSRWMEIDVGRYVQTNDNLDSVFKSGVAGSDLLQKLDDVVAKLSGSTVTQADIDGLVTLIDTAVGNLEKVNHRVSAAYGEVADVQDTTKALLLQERNALGDLQQVDQAAAIVELQNRQTTLQAAMQAYAKTASLSLFNYLG